MNTTQFKIESGVPLPKRGRTSDVQYPFEELEAGQSFFVPAEPPAE